METLPNEPQDSTPKGVVQPFATLHILLGRGVVLLKWPKGTKGTNQKWAHLTAADMTPAYIAALTDCNIGVALGPVSGDLVALDVDDDSVVSAFLAGNPDWKGTLRTRGARGCVFWFRMSGDYPLKTKKLLDQSRNDVGEFRSGGSQSIIHGIHPKGHHYTVPHLAQPLALDFATIVWPTKIPNPPTLQRDGSHLCCSAPLSTPSALSSLPAPSLCLSVKSVEEAIVLSLPEKEHQNNAVLFRLARAMLSLKASKEDQRRAFGLWHQKVGELGLLRPGQTRDEYLIEFMNACRRAKTPLGSSPAETAWKLAASEPLPPEAQQFESADGKLLVSICYQMHKQVNGEAWFLATRTAAKLTGKTHTTIATWLSALVQMGVIEIVESHTKAKATRYRYCADRAR